LTRLSLHACSIESAKAFGAHRVMRWSPTLHRQSCAALALARFSEAFLVLRAQQGGLALAWTPLVLIGMNMIYAVSAFPFGQLADKVPHTRLLAAGLLLLMTADALLAIANQGLVYWLGVALWGLHLAMTQGLLAAMVADRAPVDLRGTGYGFFNLLSGLAMLMASGLAGWLWQEAGSSFTFLTGMGLAALALLILLLQALREGATP